MLSGWAQLQHIGEELRRFAAAEWFHGMEQFHPLEICHVMTGEQSLFQYCVGL